MYSASVVGQQRIGSDAKLDHDHAVLDPHREGPHRQVRGERERTSALEIEARPVPRAGDRARLLVPVAEAERAVVVGAAILDRVQLALTVVDADAIGLVL